ncbi:MAG: hypothetical protein LBS45_03990 [Synergistaceae bacterium]|nr:hypothetical protein [Synergistaceae bacterium]
MFDSSIEDEIREKASMDGRFAVAYALLEVAKQLNRLGFNDESVASSDRAYDN